MMRKRAMFGGARVEGRWLGGWGATHVFLFLPKMEEIKYSFFSFIVRIGFCFVRIGFQFFVTFYQICTLIDWGAFLYSCYCRIAFASRLNDPVTNINSEITLHV